MAKRKEKHNYIVRWETHGLDRNSTWQDFSVELPSVTTEDVEAASKRLADNYKKPDVHYKVYIGKIEWKQL